MHLTLSYPDKPGAPRIVVEDEPEACAAFVRALLGGVPASRTAASRAERTGGPSLERRPPEPPDRAEPSPARRQRASTPDSVRSYRGRTNRRHLVLEVVRSLFSEGVHEPSLDEIRDHFARLYPDESQRNLDQVVRDLVNKTAYLERLENSRFRLTDRDRGDPGDNVLMDVF